MKMHLFKKYLKSEDVVFEPRSPPLSNSQLSEVEILLQTSVTTNSGVSLLTAPRGRVFFLGQVGCQNFHPAPNFLLLRLNLRQVQLRNRDSFLMSSLHCGIEVSWLIKSWFHTREAGWEKPRFLPLIHEVLGSHSGEDLREKLSILLSLRSRALAQRYLPGERNRP